MRINSIPNLRVFLICFGLLLSNALQAEKVEKETDSSGEAAKHEADPDKAESSDSEATAEKRDRPGKGQRPARAKKPGRGQRGVAKEDAAVADCPKQTDDADKKTEDEKTHKVEVKPFKVSAKLTGQIESVKESPVALDLKRWTEMTVVSAVDHGTTVKEGSVIIELDAEPLEKKIRELKVGMPLKELDLQIAVLELEKQEKTTPLSLEQARRSMKQAEQDLAYFEEVSRPMRERDAKEDLKSTTDYLSYAEEELNQLKKMYEADDLTEETEEIILQRAQNSVDSYRWMLEQTNSRTERILSTLLPREYENLVSQLELREINWQAGEASMKDSLEKMELEVEAKRRELEEAELALTEFEDDLGKMSVKAPQDGVVYYGMSQRGKWSTASSVERKLVPGGKLAMREIVMTISDPDQTRLRLAVPENKLKGLKKGLQGTVTLQWNPDIELSGEVESVSYVPFSDNTFDAAVNITNAAKAKAVPGMKADAEILVYENAKAMTVPKGAIKKEKNQETVTLKNGQVKKIKSGHTNGDFVEVVQGLKAGDEVRVAPAKKEAPEGKSKPEATEK
tara:strand:+ start:1861 stop:3561 length:1701 start_codon:yes stop_codon:yes gene_type:complete